MKLPITIINSDDEKMGLGINYDRYKQIWSIWWSDEGSSLNVEGKTLKEAYLKAVKKHKKFYGYDLERAGKLLEIIE